MTEADIIKKPVHWFAGFYMISASAMKGLREEKIAKEKKCEIKECKWVAEKFMKCGIKERESTNCFRKYICDPSIFCEIRKQKLAGFI